MAHALEPPPGRVWFHFLYHHSWRRRSEVTERHSCTFCLLACGTFQGLQQHLLASHDRFAYTFSDPARRVLRSGAPLAALG